MCEVLIEIFIAPIIVGVIITLFAYWLDNREK
ncbi:type I toxin-antitoxin system Fst family toxin [Salinicoccus albus]|nr:type I toxin-antitoxin system Fst family toxin [Salinicoccus albus]